MSSEDNKSKLVDDKLPNSSKNTQLDHSFSEDCKPLDGKNCEPQQKKQPIRRNRKKSIVSKPILNSSFDDCESSIEKSHEISHTKITSQPKHKKSFVSDSILNMSSIDDSVSSNIKDHEISNSKKHNLRKRKRPSASKTISCEATKVSVSTGNAQQTDTINSPTEDADFDFLPIIIKNCENKLKRIVSTAVQFQRQSRRQILMVKDFKKSLVFHNCWNEDSDCDSVVNENDSKTCRNVDDEKLVDVDLVGKWLNC